MSAWWNINVIGEPEKVLEALDQKREELDGEDRASFDHVLEALKTLVLVNRGHMVQLGASWSTGPGEDREESKETTCYFSVNPFYVKVV